MTRLWKFLFRRDAITNSLRFQLLSRSLFILAALLLLIGVFQFIFMKDFIYKNQASSIRNQTMSVPPAAWQVFAEMRDGEALVGPSTEGQPRRRPMLFLPDSSISFIDADGNFKEISKWQEGDTPPRLSVQEYRDAMKLKKRGSDYRIVMNDQGVEQLVVLQPLEDRGRNIGIAQISMSTRPLKEVLLRQLLVFAALSLCALIAGLLTFLPVLKRTLVPLSKMVGTVERIDAGNLEERFPDHQGQLEVDRLAVSFNHMLERLQLSFEAEKEAKEQMRRFVADASHELRTPLTSIHGFLEVLLRGAMNHPEQLKRSLTSMHGESERLTKLVQDLLLLAKLDRAPIMELDPGNLSSVVREMEPHLLLLAGSRSVSLRLMDQADCLFDKDKMKQVILNLFHNAIQHTDPEKGRIEISVTASAGGIELAVADNGSGIPREHLPHLFDRFYRIDSSRTRRNGGAGLGLSITKSIVDGHNGMIRVESEEGKGSVFIVKLPVHTA